MLNDFKLFFLANKNIYLFTCEADVPTTGPVQVAFAVAAFSHIFL